MTTFRLSDYLSEMLCKEGKIEASGNVLEVNHHNYNFRFMLVVYFLQSDT